MNNKRETQVRHFFSYWQMIKLQLDMSDHKPLNINLVNLESVSWISTSIQKKKLQIKKSYISLFHCLVHILTYCVLNISDLFDWNSKRYPVHQMSEVMLDIKLRFTMSPKQVLEWLQEFFNVNIQPRTILSICDSLRIKKKNIYSRPAEERWQFYFVLFILCGKNWYLFLKLILTSQS